MILDDDGSWSVEGRNVRQATTTHEGDFNPPRYLAFLSYFTMTTVLVRPNSFKCSFGTEEKKVLSEIFGDD